MKTERAHGSFRRRKFLQLTGVFVIGESLKQPVMAGITELDAVVIGHTGRGNFGHSLDASFANFPNVKIKAVADADAAGLSKAKVRLGVARAYSDYRKMIAEEKPNLVCVAPRWTEEHFDMIRTGLDAGAHIYSEKPFTTTLAEADQLLSLATRKNLRIAVAHQMRLAPNVQTLHRALDAGVIGELVQMRAYGKQDQRAGGEDMVVLGTHLFDLMRLFAGDVKRCSATIWDKKQEVKKEDRRKASEGIGWVLGDEIEAQFEFEGGVLGFFTSRGKLREQIGRWRLELIGTKGSAMILMDIDPDVMLLKAGAWTGEGRRDSWEPFSVMPASEKGFGRANHRVVADLLESIEKGREPACSGLNATKAIEMVMGVYQAGLSGGKVVFPLKERRHPLEI